MNPKQALLELAEKIDKKIEEFFSFELQTSKNISPEIVKAIENFKPACFGGKRLRGAFVYYSYLMHGGKELDEILKVSTAIELLHSYLLIHDDIMDRSDFRHSGLTIHKVYKDIALGLNPNLSENDCLHFGEGIAICAGDVLCHLALKMITDTKFEPKSILEVLNKIHREFADTGYGQIIDFFGGVLPGVNEDHVMKVHYYKTGKYTYETPLHVGAILAGGGEESLRELSEYAIPAGIAFQIQDDILGVFGAENKTGKPADSDLKEGKKTLLTVYAEKVLGENGKLKSILGNPELTNNDLETARNLFVSSGSLQYSKDKAKELVVHAKESLKNAKSDWQAAGKDFLESIADYMINREF